MCEPEREESTFWDFTKNIWPLLRQYWVAMIFFTVGIILLIIPLIIGYFNRSNKQSVVIEHSATESASIGQNTIKVDIEGAVEHPGVYELKKGDRTEDIVKKAGGFSREADHRWIIKNLNLAVKLIDGAKIYVPFLGESSSFVPPNSLNSPMNPPSLINLNSVSQSDLESLPGIGPVTAEKIIAGRPYEKIEDLLNKKIVGKSVFEKIKEKISVF